MSATARHSTPPRHPWLAQFLATPEVAFGHLLAGYASVPPYERADAPDAARMLFGPLPADDPARLALGAAILDWLERRRRTPVPAARPRLQRLVREIGEAFEIVALLDVTDAAVALRQRFALWNEWVARLALSSARDGRAAYWRMLALTQPIVARAAPAIDPLGLTPFWLHICREAGGSLPQGYLDIGLLGLRRLPEGASGSEAPWLAGLAQWALARRPSDSAFKAEWLALKALYPRQAERWRKLVGALLSTSAFRDAEIEPPAWWGGDPDFASLARQGRRSSGRPLRSPLPADCNEVIARFGEPFGKVEPSIDALMRDHRRYRDITGDSQYMVRAIHFLGQALIAPGGDDPAARAHKAQVLAREGLAWDPFNPFLWSLWRDALAAEGAPEAAELVGWEVVRCLPDDPEPRTQLASLLAEALHRPAEAEALLRETIARFPDNPHARNQLAELLIAQDRLDAATHAVDAAFGAGAADEATYALRARLQAHAGRPSGGRGHGATRSCGGLAPPGADELQASARCRPAVAATEPACGSHRPCCPGACGGRVGGRGGARRGSAARPAAPVALPAGQRRSRNNVRGRRRTAGHIRTGPNLRLRRIAGRKTTPLAGGHGQPASFAAAFEAALASGDRATLEDLAQRQPRLEALTLVARALLGDDAAAWLVETWLRTPPSAAEPQAAAALRRGLGPVLRAIDGGRAVVEVIAAQHAQIRATVYDANEAGLGDLPQAA